MIEPPELTASQIASFRRKIFAYYRRHGRRLPFRETTDPYRITVSEIMLQQTQVERVLDKYHAWIKRWPTWQRLAKAPRRELLGAWSGLGYNRRALYLGAMAKEIVKRYDGIMPDDPHELMTLPGIGPYTAHAIAIFAFNKPLVTIDTNIRKVFIHELNLPRDISRDDLEEIARRVLPRRRSRDWHNALMDYSRLALREVRDIPPVTTQSRFEGSRRQIRGEIIRRLTGRSWVRIDTVASAMNRKVEDIVSAARSLENEGVVTVTAKTIRLIE